MKKIALIAVSVITAGIVSSCCCQDQGAPGLRKMPKFNDPNQPTEVAPMVFKSKK